MCSLTASDREFRFAGAISDRQAGIALDDLLAQQRPLARFPE